VDGLKQLSENLEEWQGHPMTVRLKAVLDGLAAREERLMCLAWLEGNPPSEAERLGFHRAQRAWEDLFEASAEDILTLEKILTEQESAE
jgi:hypothetical protein|tara:strand:+ start:177 stop:443 length:267 start_codon:yes stop_codon:yes gene_type:complete